MDDAELTKQVAERVMGWHQARGECGHWYGWFDESGECVARCDYEPIKWNPLKHDAHMDMVLARTDAFGVSDIICNITTRDNIAVSECSVLANNDEYYGVSNGHSVGSVKHAMLMAILEAVT